jgi:plasmid stabilization system protein ParE
MLDRIEGVLQMLSERPKAGRECPELAPGLRSFPVGNYLLFYPPLPGGIDLVCVLNGCMESVRTTSRPSRHAGQRAVCLSYIQPRTCL